MVEVASIETVLHKLVELFKPARVILFGSHAFGAPTSDSDVDLLVVMNHRGPSHRTATKIRLALDVNFPMDILVRSSAQLQKSVRI
ncbi:MAG TPA: nucleotidyltransferase domain-containing protein [Tepidisphaeraceae bacterium]|jgi:predicted nucleotidyltransferase|nr:nucleotidyltransferase domain-containing protein [Tepidisphaeraceae bacterium]